MEEREMFREFEFGSCDNFAWFEEEDEDNLAAASLAKHLLTQLPRRLRMRICEWFIGLTRCGHTLLSKDGRFVEDQVYKQAHRDYSTLAYPKKLLP